MPSSCASTGCGTASPTSSAAEVYRVAVVFRAVFFAAFRAVFLTVARFCRGDVRSAVVRHFVFVRPGRPPARGSVAPSEPCFRLRARLVTPTSGS